MHIILSYCVVSYRTEECWKPRSLLLLLSGCPLQQSKGCSWNVIRCEDLSCSCSMQFSCSVALNTCKFGLLNSQFCLTTLSVHVFVHCSEVTTLCSVYLSVVVTRYFHFLSQSITAFTEAFPCPILPPCSMDIVCGTESSFEVTFDRSPLLSLKYILLVYCGAGVLWCWCTVVHVNVAG